MKISFYIVINGKIKYCNYLGKGSPYTGRGTPKRSEIWAHSVVLVEEGSFDHVVFTVILESIGALAIFPKRYAFYSYDYFSTKLGSGVPCGSLHKAYILEF